jgi:hypothetical protein
MAMTTLNVLDRLHQDREVQAAAVALEAVIAEQAMIVQQEADRILADHTAWLAAKFVAEDEGWRIDGHA